MGIYDQLENLNQPIALSATPAGALATRKPTTIPQDRPPRPAKKARQSEQNNLTRQSTANSTRDSDSPRKEFREDPREKARELPTRNEIQEFSFRLRDDLKVKVQAEVPARWQDELEQVARDLDVKKLELYRFILGEFLGKVRKKTAT